MNAKGKGTAAERELVHLFWAAGWGALRVAGSGSIKYPAPDLIAGNGLRRVVIECKSSADDAIYLSHKEVEELQIFAGKLAAEPWVGIRFSRQSWIFVGPEELEKTPKHFSARMATVQRRGVSFEDLTR